MDKPDKAVDPIGYLRWLRVKQSEGGKTTQSKLTKEKRSKAAYKAWKTKKK
jgi:hypothetical protein